MIWETWESGGGSHILKFPVAVARKRYANCGSMDLLHLDWI